MAYSFLEDEQLANAAKVTSCHERWKAISVGRRNAMKIREELRGLLQDYTEDSDIVVFGSLARGEWTAQSDVDWTLLVDGQVKLKHQEVVLAIRKKLQEGGHQEPGSSGVFGSFAVSHDIVHRIGGERDTNLNTTRRVLLLLESASLGPNEAVGAYERTVRTVLERYVGDAIRFQHRDSKELFVPRFLLNDIVRYWRTVCVDFVSKDWEQGGHKWALRNAKLRISRKVLFAAGMIAVFRFSQETSQDDRLEDVRLGE